MHLLATRSSVGQVWIWITGLKASTSHLL
uniref:Uncharacterized protein n=1 Tax=Rhizophora mucronata TaxID=61149 RepID=A0A2P2PVZ7_RHIMU